MKHLQLITFMERYGKITEEEKEKIKEYFVLLEVKKKQIIVEKNSLCNKL